MAGAAASRELSFSEKETWLKRPLLTLFPCLLAIGASNPDPAKVLAGRYDMDVRETIHTFEKGRWRDVPYAGARIVEIVPIAPLAAYFRAGLDYDNGHSCDISGVAKAEGDALVFHDPDPSMKWPDSSMNGCVLTIRQAGKSLRLDDGDESCKAYCGARGTLSDVRIPYASKRPIRYLDRLKHSGEYQSAIQEWRTGKPGQ